MASEVFLAVFRARFDAPYDASNESGLRWWINENIRDFIAPTYLRGNPFNPCTVRHEGHRPKALLWIIEEFFHISHDLANTDHDGRVVLCYELMIEAECHFRIKQGGGAGRRHPTSTTSNATPCPPDKLEDVAWNKPDSKTLERLVWSVYDGILSPGPTPKLTGPESYNQVTRRLASKVFRGVQVRCPTRTSAQFDEPSPVRVRSVVFAVPPSRVPKRSEAAEAMDTSPHKVDTMVQGAVEDRQKRTQIHIRWRGCVIARTLTVMRRSTSGLYSAHSRMVEGRIPGVLHVVCCPPGNGRPPFRPQPALLPQATWR